MDRPDHLAHLRREGELLLATASEGLDRPVPTCPGWTCQRLVGHIGRAHRWNAGYITAAGSLPLEKPPAGAEVVAWARDGLDQIVAAVESVDPGTVVDTWAGRQPATFWARRMAIETAVHRVDAQLAAGPDAVTPVPTDLAVDAVDELLEVVLPFLGFGDLRRDGRTIHLHATDDDLPAEGAGEWLVTLGPEVQVTHEHAKGDVAVRAPASDLLLLLWNRRGPEGLQVFGDGQVLADWQANVRV